MSKVRIAASSTIVICLFAGVLVAQDTPTPGPPPYPLQSYIGRLLDSASTQDYQAPNRTLRADVIKLDRSRDRIYMKAGGGFFFAYRLSTFTTQFSGPMAIGPHGEQYRTPLFRVNPETPGSGWQTIAMDGQERLTDFDFDDRGYVYLSYGLWGFGTVDSQGHLVKQVTAAQTGFAPQLIATFPYDTHQYVIVSHPQSGSVLWDVSDPASPQFVRSLGFTMYQYARTNTGDAIAILPSASCPTVKIYTAAQLVGGGTPVDIQPHDAGFAFDTVATDGTNFYASEHGTGNLTIISTITRATDGFSKSETISTTKSSFTPRSLTYGSGYLAYIGYDSSAQALALLYRWNGAAFEENDPRSYVQANYPGGAYRTLRQFVPYCTAAGTFGIVAAHGLGDVFSLVPAVASCLPGAPEDVSATADDASATVSFSPPTSDGGSAITSYTVKSNPGGITASGASSPVSVSGLSNGVTYTFTVTAMNPVGLGPASSPSNETTPGTTLVPPVHLAATAAGTTQVSVVWSAAAKAAHYDVLRSSMGSAFDVIATPAGCSYIDTNVEPNTTYLYEVRSVDSGSSASGPTAVDPATTIAFTDDPLVSGSTVQTAHMNELRVAVNAMRAAAGLDPATYTDGTLSGTAIKAVHLNELRTGLSAAISALHLVPLTYSDSDITPGVTPIRAVHLQEIRDAVK